MIDDPLITIDDIRKAGICVSGTRSWFRQEGLDFADMLANGIAASKLTASGDAMALRVVDFKRNRENG